VSATLICSHRALARDLERTLIGRDALDRHLAHDLAEAVEAARTHRVDLVIVDAEMPGAVDLVRGLRQEVATRRVPVAVLAAHRPDDQAPREFRDAGATDVLRFPPAADWDERLFRLLPFAPRREVRQPAALDVDVRGAYGAGRATIVDLSAGGMLTDGPRALYMGERLRVRFRLPTGGPPVVGTAWVVRKSADGGWGLEFLYLDGDGSDHLRRYTAPSAS
jgi:CheY-like chemotaxis protein